MVGPLDNAMGHVRGELIESFIQVKEQGFMITAEHTGSRGL